MRFTPTGVGTIGKRKRVVACTAVHPHGRGDNRLRDQHRFLRHGSPPRAWGQSPVWWLYCPFHRFTPTGVGTITSATRSFTPASVHPHGRGDNYCNAWTRSSICGSPPRAWGQFAVELDRVVARRFTPTGVGTIAPASRRLPAAAVHPHGRGDNKTPIPLSTSSGGSPPRAWGQCSFARNSARCNRFTPTGVGTILPRRRTGFSTTVHPHGRGDNKRREQPAALPDGSPPRAWGQSGAPRTAAIPQRFTPTGVGTIAGASRCAETQTVHPHGRGDNFSAWEVEMMRNGSPPRAWGQCNDAALLETLLGSPPRAWGQFPDQQHQYTYPRFTPTGVGTM